MFAVRKAHLSYIFISKIGVLFSFIIHFFSSSCLDRSTSRYIRLVFVYVQILLVCYDFCCLFVLLMQLNWLFQHICFVIYIYIYQIYPTNNTTANYGAGFGCDTVALSERITGKFYSGYFRHGTSNQFVNTLRFLYETGQWNLFSHLEWQWND